MVNPKQVIVQAPSTTTPEIVQFDIIIQRMVNIEHQVFRSVDIEHQVTRSVSFDIER